MSDEPEKVNLESPDLAEQNRAALAELFPGVLEDGVLDVQRLSELLDVPPAQVHQGRERYGLQWAGKQEAVRSLLTPSRGTLVPDLDASIDFDTAQNVFIEGDNLEVLKLLQKAYNDKVKLIYIDPPYNTGNDFVYNDDFSDGLRGYLEYTGQVDAEGNRTSANSDTSGRRHSRWLSMMYPRLMLARNLLTQDGVIMVHIDENEVAALILLMDEIFGEENELGEIVWDKRNPKGDANGISSQHEYVLVYARSRDLFIESGGFASAKSSAEKILQMATAFWATVGKKQVPADLAESLKRHGAPADLGKPFAVEVTPERARRQFARWLRSQPFAGGELAYDKIDDDGEVYRLVSMAWPNKKQAPAEYFIPLIHPVTGRECPVPARGWRNPPATMQRLLDEGRIVFGADETTQPQRKYLLRENMTTSLASIIQYGGSDDRLLSELGIPFDTPKPVDLIRQLLGACTRANDVVMDFFAGSGSTAHAVALQNALDGKRRRCISVNVPEPVAPGSEAALGGFLTVSEITLRRLTVVVEAVPAAKEQGLRALRLGASSFSSPDVHPGEGLFSLSERTLVPAAPDLDAVAAEVFLKEGVTLDQPWERHVTEQAEVVVAGGVAVVLSTDLDDDLVRTALDLGPRVVVFLEDGFAGADAVKANAVTNARQRNVTLKTV